MNRGFDASEDKVARLSEAVKTKRSAAPRALMPFS